MARHSIIYRGELEAVEYESPTMAPILSGTTEISLTYDETLQKIKLKVVKSEFNDEKVIDLLPKDLKKMWINNYEMAEENIEQGIEEVIKEVTEEAQIEEKGILIEEVGIEDIIEDYFAPQTPKPR